MIDQLRNSASSLTARLLNLHPDDYEHAILVTLIRVSLAALREAGSMGSMKAIGELERELDAELERHAGKASGE